MNKSKVIATAIVAVLLAVAMLGLRHTDKLNDQIELKQIQIKDGNLKLKIYDQKLDEVDKQLREKTINAEEADKQRQKIEKENQELREALQAKQKQKASDLAVKTQKALGGTQVASAATGSCADWIRAAGIADVANANELIRRESGCNPSAINRSSGACGVAQELPCGKSGCSLGDGACQVRWMNSYTLARYGSWANAVAFHNANNWY